MLNGRADFGLPVFRLGRLFEFSTFSFDHVGAKEKVAKRKAPQRISPLARGGQGSAYGNRKPLKRLERNFKKGWC